MPRTAHGDLAQGTQRDSSLKCKVVSTKVRAMPDTELPAGSEVLAWETQ